MISRESRHARRKSHAEEGEEILEGTEAEDVWSTGEAMGDFSKSNQPMPRAS
jgi:hypothetical protein